MEKLLLKFMQNFTKIFLKSSNIEPQINEKYMHDMKFDFSVSVNCNSCYLPKKCDKHVLQENNMTMLLLVKAQTLQIELPQTCTHINCVIEHLIQSCQMLIILKPHLHVTHTTFGVEKEYLTYCNYRN